MRGIKWPMFIAMKMKEKRNAFYAHIKNQGPRARGYGLGTKQLLFMVVIQKDMEDSKISAGMLIFSGMLMSRRRCWIP